MKCDVCGSELRMTMRDFPFKARETAIVILRDLPVLQCGSCPQYLLEDSVLTRVDVVLTRVGSEAELEIVSYAA